MDRHHLSSARQTSLPTQYQTFQRNCTTVRLIRINTDRFFQELAKLIGLCRRIYAVRVREIMSRNVITIDADASVIDAIRTMLSHHISGLPVIDQDGALIGILSEGDFIRRVEVGTEKRRGRWLAMLAGTNRVALDFARQHGRKVRQIMSPKPIAVEEDTPLEQVVQLMESHGVTRFPVMRDNELVGMVTRTDFMTAVAALRLDLPITSGNDDQIRASVLAALAHAPWRPAALQLSVRDGIVNLRGSVRSDNAHKAVIVAVENVAGVKRVDDQLVKVIHPPPEEDYGGGDFVSLQEETPTEDDQPL
ncbi:CBS domain-containing protein [Bradyrhizobium sp. CCBAU 51753]|uniref:CBS domain-containing protein n=1 Tax=Bradyrhizobium sp. CCBAU 51753 TaxID=1325100 RepID=UPI001FEED4D6|nr:CBS domain-containing protein [Bradyrhizobium sp. CCBAU 51753]